MHESQVRGLFFEGIVKRLLEASGFTCVQTGNIKGRGEFHQIDAYGRFYFQVPFVYPIRVLAEAKWYERAVGLNHIRDFVGVIKDISENYFVEQGLSRTRFAEILEKRYNDCGAIFSATSFTLPAQHYAYAHGIYLVPFEGNTILSEVRQILKELIAREKRLFNLERYENIEEGKKKLKYREVTEDLINKSEELQSKLEGIGSYLGLLDGIYPIHLISTEKLDFMDPSKPDLYEISPIEKEYMRRFDFDVLFVFRDRIGIEIQFTIPNYILRSMFRVAKSMEKEFFKFIDTPTMIRWQKESYRRIFQLGISDEDRRRIISNLRKWNIIPVEE